MSIRERWTVYPLLFLAILMAARNDLFPSERSRFRSIECQELVVTNVNRENLVYVGETTEQSGMIVLYGNVPSRLDDEPQGPERADKEPRSSGPGIVRSPVVELGAESDGGILRLRSIAGIPTICVGHQSIKGLSGLIALEEEDRVLSREKSIRDSFWGTAFSRADFRNSPEADDANPKP
jgi:hypothetical protein